MELQLFPADEIKKDGLGTYRIQYNLRKNSLKRSHIINRQATAVYLMHIFLGVESVCIQTY